MHKPMKSGSTARASAGSGDATGSQASAVARLKELKSLLNQGLISQAEYQTESQKVLNQIVE
jgi:hypothetical protein